MLQLALLCTHLLVLQSPTLQLKRVALLPVGSAGSSADRGCIVDSDHDGWEEFGGHNNQFYTRQGWATLL